MALAAYTYRSLLCEQYFYTDEYAGSFIDKFGILNVGVVGLPQAKSEYFGQVNYLPKQFSYNFLKDLKAELSDTMDDLGIFTVGIDEERNQVFVNLTDEKNVDKTVAFLAEKDIYRENSIRFLVEPNGCNKEDSTAPYGGECISGGGFSGTMAVTVIDNLTGLRGILTNEHVAPIGRSMSYRGQWNGSTYSENIALGDPLRAQNGGTIDASFVPFTNQANWENTPYGKYHTTTYSNIRLGNNTQIVQGHPVLRIGKTTGVTVGTISSASVDYISGGILKTDTFIYTNEGESGDSGGPVYYSDGTDLHLIGIHFSSNNAGTEGAASRIQNIMNVLNIAPITNDSFTTSNYGSGVSIDGITFNPTGAFNIPTAVKGKTVTQIGNSTFSNQTQLSQITIPASVTSIGNSAFCGCTSLSSVSIPSSVTHIGIEAFNPSTVLTSFSGDNRGNIDLIVVDGTKDTYIANGWTGFNSIIELSATGPLTVTSGQLRGIVEIPPIFNNRAITAIGDYGFANQTQLTGISILSVRSIGREAFANCSELEEVYYWSVEGLTVAPDHSTSYSNYNYTERSLDISLEAGFTYSLSFDYSNLIASTDITNVFTSLGVGETTYAVDLPVQKSFSSTSGTQVIVFTPTEAQLASSKKLWCRFIRTGTPQSVSINISNVEIELGMNDIDSSAFMGCEKLSSPGLDYRLLPNTTDKYAVTGLSGLEATYCLLSGTLFIPSNFDNGSKQVTQIDPSAFADNEYIKWVFMQTGITSVGNRAFQFCSSLEMVNMSATSVTTIEDYTFDVCTPNTLDNKLDKVLLPSGLLIICEGAFIRTNMSIDTPHSVTSIGSYAFAYGDRASFRLPNNLITIGSYAFAYSESLALGYTGSSLTTIGERAFYETPLPALTEIFPSITTIGAYAFCNSSFYSNFALSAGSQLTGIANYAFKNTNLTRIVIPSSISTIGQGAFSGNTSLTIYTERTSKPSTWNSYWNISNRPVVWGCTLSSDKTYVLSFTKNSSNPSNPGATNGITDPYRKGYTFGGWYTTANFSGNPVENIASVEDNTILYAKWNKNSCVAEGTLITLADGSQVAVEDLTGSESLLVWNLFTGTFDIAPILFIDSDPYSKYEIIHLYFSDGTEVKVIDEHAFWDIDLNEYVFLRNNAAQYIGDWFNKQTDDGNGNMIWTAVQLVDVEIYDENTTAWSPVTFGHLCYFVNGMLSMPGATEGLINIFEVDRVTMQYDETLFASDIATYGFFTYEEFSEIIPIPEVIFEAFNGQYLKVSIGKGLITMDRLVALIERYAGFFTEEKDNTPDFQDDQKDHGNHHGHNNGHSNHNGQGNGNGNHNGHRCKGR